MKLVKTVLLEKKCKIFNDKVIKAIFVLFLVSLFGMKSFGQISILSLPYVPGTTNFNAYNPTSLANLNGTIPVGWTASTAGSAVYNGQGNGTGAAAGYWALGTGGEFSLGSVPSSASDNITYTVSFVNNSGSTITTLAISWDYEQWRFSSGNASSINCTATGALLGNATINGSDYASVGGTDGTVSTTVISFVLTGLNITNGSSFGMTWVAANAGSAAADKGIGIDNFSITASRTNPTDHFRTRQTGNWNASSTWESSVDAITWVNSNASPDFNASTITVRNGHTATVTSSVSVDQTFINTGGQITINTGQTLTIPVGTGTDLTVDGTLVNNGAISQTGTIAFNASSLYTHGINGGAIPTATWNATSTCNITGLTNAAPIGLNQNFGHFTYDCPNHSNLINFNSALTSIAGNFTVRYAGEEQGIRTLNGLALSSNTSFTLNIGGNLIVDHYTNEATWLIMTTGTANVTMNVAGDFLMSNTGGSGSCFFDFKHGTTTAMGALVLNVSGNLTMTGGYLDMGYQASSYTTGTELRLNGNLSVSATSTIITSGTNIVNGTIIFNRAGTQTMFEAAAGVTAYVNYRVNSGSTTSLLSNFYLYDYITGIKSGNFIVQNGGVLDMNTFTLHGYYVAGGSINTVNTYTSFTLNSGAGIITANANGVHRIGFINGSISAAIATRTFSSAANYTYDGTVTQNSGTFVTSPVTNQVNNITISNTSGNTTGVTLEQPIAVAGICTFNTGLLTTSTTNLLTINNDATTTGAKNTPVYSFANGPVKKIGNDAFTFPVGKLFGGYRFLSITAPANTTDEFTCEFLRANARLLGPVSAPLTRVSQCEYWDLDKNSSAAASIQVTISWNELSPCNATYITNPFLLAVARFEGPNWINAGFFPINGTNTAGDITSTLLSDFGYFALGSRDFLENVLPTALFDLQLQKNKEGIAVNWKNTKEEKVAYYQVMRSTNGKDFIPVAVINATQNNGNEARYNFIDRSASQAVYYYRIRLMNTENDQFYSNTAKINLENNKGSVNILSNPVTDHRLGLQLNDLPAGIYNLTLVNSSGQVVYKNSINHISGSSTYGIQLSSTLTKGVYYLQVNSATGKYTRSILIQ